jgi:hypothetical protein
MTIVKTFTPTADKIFFNPAPPPKMGLNGENQ